MDENKLEGIELNDDELEDVSGGSIKDAVHNIFMSNKVEQNKSVLNKFTVNKEVHNKVVLNKQVEEGKGTKW